MHIEAIPYWLNGYEAIFRKLHVMKGAQTLDFTVL